MKPTPQIISFDERRDLIVLATLEEAIQFAAEHWIHQARRALQQRGRFAVALSGGKTPAPIYKIVSQSKEIDWTHVWLFWSDERSVAPDHAESNYRMAMDAGFRASSIPKGQILRMHAEKDLRKNAQEYEELILRHLEKHLFDLVLLGVGEDGHTASLFPHTPALKEEIKLVVANSIGPEKGERMTLTFPCINRSAQAVFLAFGAHKQEIVAKVLQAPIDSPWPASRIGTPEHKALWILDEPAAQKINIL